MLPTFLSDSAPPPAFATSRLRCCIPSAPGAFTLIELLVVISIIGVLSALLLPVLVRDKAKAQGIVCMSNSRQLALAMQLYAHDFQDLFPPNPDDSNTMDGYNWCPGNVSGGFAGQPPGADTFNPTILKNEKKCLIAPYVKNIGIFKCPADQRSGLYRGADPALAGKIVPAARSISMNQGVGTIDPAFDAHPENRDHDGVPRLPVNGPWLDGHGHHRHNQPYATFGRTTDFDRVSASQIFLTLDESQRSINDGAFGVSAAVAMWVDFPANYHNNACGFSFCDAHGEVHKWRTGALNIPANVGLTPGVAPNNVDWIWLKDHATARVQ
jgi:prepilin-type N-terminal cleavage/methylation domain-containing protein